MRQGALHKRCFLLLSLAQDEVLQAPAFVLDALHQTARPDKFSGQQTRPEKNHPHSRRASGQHNATCQEQGGSSHDEEDPADLLDRAEDHGPPGKRLSGGEVGIRTHGTVSRTLAFEASTFTRSVTSPRSL